MSKGLLYLLHFSMQSISNQSRRDRKGQNRTAKMARFWWVFAGYDGFLLFVLTLNQFLFPAVSHGLLICILCQIWAYILASSSLINLVHAIAYTHTSTRATSLMRVKYNTRHFCLWHLLSGTLKWIK